MFGIGGFELFIIVVFIFVVFGPDKLPEIIKIAGLLVKKFRKAKSEMDSILKEEIVDPVMKEANKPDNPTKNKNKVNLSGVNSDISNTDNENCQIPKNESNSVNTEDFDTKKEYIKFQSSNTCKNSNTEKSSKIDETKNKNVDKKRKDDLNRKEKE